MFSVPLRSYLLLYASMTLVGTYVALSKPLVALVPVFLLALLRFAIGAVAMLPWTLRGPAEAPLSRGEHAQLFLMSFFGNFLFSLCMLNGIARTTATAAGVILATLPAAVALLSWLLLRERLSLRAWAAIALAVLGIALLQLTRNTGDNTEAVSMLGNALLLGAVLCEAIYVILAKRLSATRAPLRISALINLWGLVLIAPLGVWQLAAFDLRVLSLNMWALLLFYSLSAGLFAVWLWMAGMKHVPAHRAGVFTVALPIAATAIGVLLLGETLTAMHIVALVCALAGIVLIAAHRHEA